jgi:hypothetical protein
LFKIKIVYYHSDFQIGFVIMLGNLFTLEVFWVMMTKPNPSNNSKNVQLKKWDMVNVIDFKSLAPRHLIKFRFFLRNSLL